MPLLAQEASEVEQLRRQLKQLQDQFEKQQQLQRQQIEALRKQIESLQQAQAASPPAAPSVAPPAPAAEGLTKSWSPSQPIRIGSGGAYAYNHDAESLRGVHSYRQIVRKFPIAGGTFSGYGLPGPITWARAFVRDEALVMDLGRGEIVSLPEAMRNEWWQGEIGRASYRERV